MKIFSLLLLFLFYTFLCLAQQLPEAYQLQGLITDPFRGDTLYNVAVTNLTSGQYVARYLPDGVFSVAVHQNDRIRFSLAGYQTQELLIYSENESQFQHVWLRRKPIPLDTVIISGLTEYQEDSLARRLMFGKKVDEKAAQFRVKRRDKAYGSDGPGAGTFRMEAPLSSLIQKRSKKYKKLVAFQNRFKKTENELFIESRYDSALVTKLTGLEGDQLLRFIKAHPMPLDFARAASELEIGMWVRYNYRQWNK